MSAEPVTRGRTVPGVYLLAAGAVVLGVVSVTLRFRLGTHSDADLLFGGLAGGLFVIAGMVAHHRHPANAVGPLMVLVGIGWYAEDLQLSSHPVVHTAGLMLVTAAMGFLVHLVLAFPTGRLSSRPQRLLGAAAYLAVFGLSPLRVLFFDPAGAGDRAPNLLRAADWPQGVGYVDDTVQLIGGVVTVGVVVVLVRRWAAAGRQLRLLLAPVLLTGLVGAAGSLAYGLLGDAAAGRAFLVVYKVSFCLLPLGLLIGLLAAAAAAAERMRLERDLHDGAQQHLVAAALNLRLTQRRLDRAADPESRVLLNRTVDQLEAALAQLRQLAAGSPPGLAGGLVPAVRQLTAGSPVPVELAADQLPRLPGEVESTAYFVVTEALTNTLKHAQASRCQVHLDHQGDRLRVRVDDDGTGTADPDCGTGLAGLRDRVRRHGGDLTVHSRPGAGTTVTATIPAGR